MFLTAAEVKDLTGYTYPARQIAWLKRKGYRFEVNRMGRPVVPCSAVEAKIGKQKTAGPNWEAFK